MAVLESGAALATFVSLFLAYRTELRTSNRQDVDGFLEYLAEQGHDELRSALEANRASTVAVHALLSQSREEVMAKLEAVDELLASLVSGIEDLADVAEAIHPGVHISEQAMSILRQLDESGGTGFIVSKAMRKDPELEILDGSGGKLEYIERRFLEDDLATLEDLGLLRGEVTSQGCDRYRITREAVKLARLSVEGE